MPKHRGQEPRGEGEAQEQGADFLPKTSQRRWCPRCAGHAPSEPQPGTGTAALARKEVFFLLPLGCFPSIRGSLSQKATVICKRSPGVQGGDEIIKWGDLRQHIQLHGQQVLENLNCRRVAVSTAGAPTFWGARGSDLPREAGAGVSPQRSTVLVTAPKRTAHGDVPEPGGAAGNSNGREINRQ